MPDKDLLSLWNSHLKHSTSDGSPQNPPVQSPEQTPADDRPEKTKRVPELHKADASPQAQTMPDSATAPEKTFRAAPLLSGRIADYLSAQTPRKISSELIPAPDTNTPWIVTDPKSKLSLATALILTANLARFSGTALPEPQLIKTRDELMRTLSAKDAVNAEVEAYDILNWLAGALNENLRKSDAPDENIPCCTETTEAALIDILQDAIRHKRDITMRYYTGSRGAFSERRISPIEITAEKYLIAFCHVRDEERVFRLTRIVSLVPIPNPGEAQQNLLCYPNTKDIELPPLPNPPAPAPIHDDTDNSRPTRHRRRSRASQNASGSKKQTKSATSPQNNKPPAAQGDSNQTRTLFDLIDDSHTTKSPPKKKRSPKPRFLPGLLPD